MSRSKKMLRGVIGLVIMACILIGVNKWSDKKDEMNKESETSNQPIVHIIQEEASQLERLTIKQHDQELIIDNKQEPILVGFEKVVLQRGILEEIIHYYSRLTGDKVVEKHPEDLHPYGLETPKAIITGTFNQKDVIVYIGHKTLDENYYYVKRQDREEVYLIKSHIGSYFTKSLDDMRERNLMDINRQYCDYISIKKQGEKPITIAYNYDNTPEATRFGIGQYHMTEPYSTAREVSKEDFIELIKEVPPMVVDTFIEDDTTDLSTYGLDNPMLSIHMQSNNMETQERESLHVHFGQTVGELIYFKYADKQEVYTMRQDKIQNLLQLDAFDFITRLIYITSLQNIEAISITNDNVHYGFNIQKKASKDKMGNSELEFLHNEQILEDKAFRKVYENIIGISADKEINDIAQASQEDEINIELMLRDGQTVKLRYIRYNELFYYYEVEEGVYFICSAKQLNRMMAGVQAIIND